MLLSVAANASTIIQISSQLRYSHAIGLNSQVAVAVHSSTNLRDLKSMYRILKHISETKDGFSKRYFNENIAAKFEGHLYDMEYFIPWRFGGCDSKIR